jgi:hypothetical protein
LILMLLMPHAPAQHPRPLLRGYRVHTLICRGSGLPLFFLLSPANFHDAPFAQPRLSWAVYLYRIRPRVIRLDAAYWSLRLITWIHGVLGAVAVIRFPSQTRSVTVPVCLPLGGTRGVGQAQWHPSLRMARVFLFFHLQRPPLSGWSTITRQVAASLHSHRHRCFSCATGRPSRSHPLSKARFSSCVGGLMSEEIPSTDVLSSQHNLFFLSPFPFSSDPATHAPRELRAAPSNA